MVFKRRDKRPLVHTAMALVYPRGGWARAFRYMRHRVRRLPDSPHRIARGIGAGVFAAFTPFYGIHFLVAAAIAKPMNGNLLAALAGTFFGNPLTYIPIGAICLKTGHFILGTRFDEDVNQSLFSKFLGAAHDLLDNFIALFTSAQADWTNLVKFFYEVFLPYLVGGIIPGLIAATICYYLSVPVVDVYQKHRRTRLKKKMDERRAKAGLRPDHPA